jgi:hypothetical protein
MPDPDSNSFTRHKFGVQNFGGLAQIIATAGIGLDPFLTVSRLSQHALMPVCTVPLAWASICTSH